MLIWNQRNWKYTFLPKMSIKDRQNDAIIESQSDVPSRRKCPSDVHEWWQEFQTLFSQFASVLGSWRRSADWESRGTCGLSRTSRACRSVHSAAPRLTQMSISSVGLTGQPAHNQPIWTLKYYTFGNMPHFYHFSLTKTITHETVSPKSNPFFLKPKPTTVQTSYWGP